MVCYVDERTRDTLKSLLALSDVAERLVARGRAAYDEDEMLRLAAESILRRFGATISRVPAGFAAAHPEVNWNPMRDTLDAIEHGFPVDHDLIWLGLAQRRPSQAIAIRKILDDE